jgi:hypothetical protein
MRSHSTLSSPGDYSKLLLLYVTGLMADDKKTFQLSSYANSFELPKTDSSPNVQTVVELSS